MALLVPVKIGSAKFFPDDSVIHDDVFQIELLVRSVIHNLAEKETAGMDLVDQHP
jgi:hypothetical protein